MTARDLAQRLEVCERTIHRDMVALGAAGIPVTAERGVGGGWALLEGYRTNLTGLTEAEEKVLRLAESVYTFQQRRDSAPVLRRGRTDLVCSCHGSTHAACHACT
jgi:predicted DNA-binding transcriptional regulator YafY